MFIKDCTILYTATVGAAPFFSACSNRQTCFAGADFQEIYPEIHIWRGLCSSAPSSSAHRAAARLLRAGPSAAAAAVQNPCNFKSKCQSLHEHSLSHHNALRHLVSD